jgi:pimeloyl-ACP methyl ester carboxylesterase
MPQSAYQFWTDNHAFKVPYGERSLYAWSWGSGPVVLLVHGWSGRGAHYFRFIPPLARRGFRVVTFDAPAHGFSEGARTNLLDFAGALMAMVEAVVARGARLHGLIAYSFGAPAAMLAARHALPVEKLVLVAPPVDMQRFTEDFARAVGLPPAALTRFQDGLEARFGLRWQDVHTDRLAADIAAARHLPTMVVHDRDDARVPWDHGARVAGHAGGTLVTTTGLGHTDVLFDRPVVEKIGNFLAEQEPVA